MDSAAGNRPLATDGSGGAARRRAHAARRLWRAAGRRLPVKVYRRTRDHWAAFDTREPVAAAPMPAGWELTRAGHADLPVLQELGIAFAGAARLLDAGHRWFLLRDRGRPIFSTWAFTATMPTDAAPEVWVPLPPEFVNTEDAFIPRDVRHRGVASIAAVAVAHELRNDAGVRWLISVMHRNNMAIRTAVAKTGAREFAVVDIRKFGVIRTRRNWRERRPDGPLVWTWVRISEYRGAADLPASPHAAELTKQLRSVLREGLSSPFRSNARGALRDS